MKVGDTVLIARKCSNKHCTWAKAIDKYLNKKVKIESIYLDYWCKVEDISWSFPLESLDLITNQYTII